VHRFIPVVGDIVFTALSKKAPALSGTYLSAFGRSKEVRYYGLVEVEGKSLVEILVSSGLARIVGHVVPLPSGEKSTAYKKDSPRWKVKRGRHINPASRSMSRPVASSCANIAIPFAHWRSST
jgi:hypothetical protein